MAAAGKLVIHPVDYLYTVVAPCDCQLVGLCHMWTHVELPGSSATSGCKSRLHVVLCGIVHG